MSNPIPSRSIKVEALMDPVVQTVQTIPMHIHFFRRFSASSYVAASHQLYQIVELWVTLVGVEDTDNFLLINISIRNGWGKPASSLGSEYKNRFVLSLDPSNNSTPYRFMGPVGVCTQYKVHCAMIG